VLLHSCLIACTAAWYTASVKALAMLLSCCPCLHLLLLLLLSVSGERDGM
jgi:hypothetical protein